LREGQEFSPFLFLTDSLSIHTADLQRRNLRETTERELRDFLFREQRFLAWSWMFFTCTPSHAEGQNSKAIKSVISHLFAPQATAIPI
jgi:hypothetical protein